MPTLRSSDTGHLADFIMNTYAKWCTSMLLPLPKVSTTELSAGAGENPWWNETWSWNPPPWSSSALTPPGRTLQTFTRMFISFGDCLGGVAVKRVLKNAFTRTFWTPSKNASSVSGHLHHWRQNRDRAEPGAPSPGPHARFIAPNHANYKRFMAAKRDSCEEVLAVARDTHQWALVATALLEDKIERMIHSLSCWYSGSHWHSGSCWCLARHWWRRSQTTGHQPKVPQAMPCHGNTAKRWAQSPSPPQPRWQVTFAKGWAPLSSKNSPGRDTRIGRAHWLPLPTWGDERTPDGQSDWSGPKAEEEGDLECLPPLEPHLQELLSGEETFLAGTGAEGGLMWTSTPNDPKPSPMENAEWIQWHAWQVDMPVWWWEL